MVEADEPGALGHVGTLAPAQCGIGAHVIMPGSL
jgi:hypothetical protein